MICNETVTLWEKAAVDAAGRGRLPINLIDKATAGVNWKTQSVTEETVAQQRGEAGRDQVHEELNTFTAVC